VQPALQFDHDRGAVVGALIEVAVLAAAVARGAILLAAFGDVDADHVLDAVARVVPHAKLAGAVLGQDRVHDAIWISPAALQRRTMSAVPLPPGNATKCVGFPSSIMRWLRCGPAFGPCDQSAG